MDKKIQVITNSLARPESPTLGLPQQIENGALSLCRAWPLLWQDQS
jgi:hypothetical protein